MQEQTLLKIPDHECDISWEQTFIIQLYFYFLIKAILMDMLCIFQREYFNLKIFRIF